MAVVDYLVPVETLNCCLLDDVITWTVLESAAFHKVLRYVHEHIAFINVPTWCQNNVEN